MTTILLSALLSVLIAMMYLALGFLTLIIALLYNIRFDSQQKENLPCVQSSLAFFIIFWPIILVEMTFNINYNVNLHYSNN
ncbi:MAG: hypothetical protein AAB969_04135 [Patescibacteria group bacterium]